MAILGRKLTRSSLFSAIMLIVLIVGAVGCEKATEAPEAQPTTPAGVAPTTAPPAAEGKSITVWGFVWTADWLDAIAPGFEAEHPGVKVKVERFEYDPYQDMVLTTLASGEGVPDVVTLDPMWAGDLIRGETVLPLDKATTELNVADFVPGGWNLYAWKGIQYGIPLDLDFNLLFYRNDIYETAMATLGMTEFPRNTADFIEVGEQVVKDTGKPAVIQFQGDYYAWYQSFLAPMGGNLISDDATQYIFNNEAAVKALELYGDLANQYKIGKLWDFDTDGDPIVALKNSEANAIMYGSWFATELASGAPDMAGKWSIAPLPWGDADRKYDAATGGACLSIPVNAAEPDLAWEFIKYSMTPANQVEYFKIVAGVPSLKTSWTDPAFDEVNEFFGIPLGRNVANWSLRVMPMQLPSMEVADLIGEAIQLATTGQKTAKEALDEAVDLAPPLE